MNRLSLQFLIAYADFYKLQDKPVTEVIELTANYLNSDRMMRSFLKIYRMLYLPNYGMK